MDVENPRLLVGLIIKLFPDVVILELVETLKDSRMVPDVLPDLNSMVPVPFDGGEVNVRVTLVSIPTLVAPLAGLMELKVNGIVVKL
jgi:hypothetical protein